MFKQETRKYPENYLPILMIIVLTLKEISFRWNIPITGGRSDNIFKISHKSVIYRVVPLCCVLYIN